MGVGPGAPLSSQCSVLWPLGSHGSRVVDWLMSLVLSTLGLSGDGTQPSRAPLSDATSLKLELREILLFFFFFLFCFGVEIKCDLNSPQSQGRGPLRKISLSALSAVPSCLALVAWAPP